MAIIMISRGSYARGGEVAEMTAQKLGYQCISREILLQASKDFNIPEITLLNAMKDAQSFLDRFTRRREKYIAYIRAALLKRLQKDNAVYHGFAGQFLVRDIPYVLKVRIISDMEDRAKTVMEQDHLSEKEAWQVVRKVDDQRRRWALSLYGIDPEDSSLYDLVLNIRNLTVMDAVDHICRMSKLSQFKITPEAGKTLENLALAAEVKTFLIDVKPRAEVFSEDGMVFLKTKAPVTEDSELVNVMGDIVKMVPAVKGIKVLSEREMDDRYAGLSDPTAKSAKAASTFFTDV